MSSKMSLVNSCNNHFDDSAKRNKMNWLFIIIIVSVHVFMITWMSFWNSPNGNEPGHLAAGVYTLRFGRTDLYRVNPPLSRMIAAIPATYLFGIDADWLSTATNILSYRPEYEVGTSLYFKNDPSKLYYAFAFGRLMLLPFALLGAWTCYRFAYELYGKHAALLALVLWCFNPYVLTWSATINPDITATSLGIFSFYLFWKWCRQPSWRNTLLTGGLCGLLFVSKTIWIFVIGIWSFFWIFVLLSHLKSHHRPVLMSLGKLCLIFLMAILILNVFYNFSGSFQQLKKYSFISAALTNPSSDQTNAGKNRFAESWPGEIPIPLPQDYVYGIDVQKYDFERGIPSYINGVWSEHGCWYYYMYAFFLKTPIGFQFLTIGAVILFFVGKRWRSTFFNECVLFIPLIFILILISSQQGFSVHSRYLLPLLPFLFVLTSRIASIFNTTIEKPKRLLLVRMTVLMLILWGVISSLSVFPHSMSYFNEIAGGPKKGSAFLLGSDLDWGQDAYYLKQWQKKYPQNRPLRISLSGTMPLENIGIKSDGVVPKEGDGSNVFAAIKPGWYAVNINSIYNQKKEYQYLQNKIPVARAGYSILIYNYSQEEVENLRKSNNLLSLNEEKNITQKFFNDLLERKTKAAEKIKIAVYIGGGVSSDSAQGIKNLLDEENYSCNNMDIDNIRNGELSNNDLLIVPGGLSNEMADALGKEGREAIRQFVKSGGGYIGICAGAYLASSTFERFLGLVNIKTNHSLEYMPRQGTLEQRQLGSASVKITFSKEGQELFSVKDAGEIQYINGPIFIEAGDPNLPPFITLATYCSDVYQYRFQQGTMPNTPSIVAGRFGLGHVILFSPHPELTKCTKLILLEAIRTTKMNKGL